MVPGSIVLLCSRRWGSISRRSADASSPHRVDPAPKRSAATGSRNLSERPCDRDDRGCCQAAALEARYLRQLTELHASSPPHSGRPRQATEGDGSRVTTEADLRPVKSSEVILRRCHRLAWTPKTDPGPMSASLPASSLATPLSGDLDRPKMPHGSRARCQLRRRGPGFAVP
jgi:hypothetical protein